MNAPSIPGAMPEPFPAPRDPVPGPAPSIPVLRDHFRSSWDGWGPGRRDAFLQNLAGGTGAPLVEPDPDGRSTHRAVTFFHLDPAASAVILSANALVNHLDVSASEFEWLGNCGLWALTYLMPADWESGYRVTVHPGPGPAPWRAAKERRSIRMAADAGGPDPLNPVLGAGMNGGATSVVRLPAAPAAPWLATVSPRPCAGSPAMGGDPSEGGLPCSEDAPGLECLRVTDSSAGRVRTVWLYSPPPGSAAGPTPLLLLHDGQVWAKYLNLKATLDAAVGAGVVPAIHVAMIDSLDVETRSRELSGPTGTVDFVAVDLLPLLRRRLPVRTDAPGTIVSGASYGGLASLWQLARHPHLVGVALAQSPSLWRYDLAGPLGDVLDRVTIRLQAGIYEPDIHETTQRLYADLVPLGADVGLCTVTGGHDWAWWNTWLIHGLAELLDTAPSCSS